MSLEFSFHDKRRIPTLASLLSTPLRIERVVTTQLFLLVVLSFGREK